MLRERGVELIGPDEGELAEGERRRRADEPSRRRSSRAARSCSATPGPSLAGKRVLVSAGGTREPLDAVRFVGNRSSGRMGVAVAAEARAARRRGDARSPRTSPSRRRAGVEVVADADRRRPRARGARRAADADVVVMAAAVADYRPAEADARQATEGRGDVDGRARADRRTCSPSSAAGARERPGARRLRGGRGRRRPRASPREARRQGRSNLFVFNDVSRSDIGFDAPDNEVVLVDATRRAAVGKAKQGGGRGGDPRRGRDLLRGG